LLGCDEEQIATGLGLVSHVICMLSKYLEIPLRYPTIPMCSRSIIRDDTSPNNSLKFRSIMYHKDNEFFRYPLYSKGVDRTRFEYGVFLLNKDVEQVLTIFEFELSIHHQYNVVTKQSRVGNIIFAENFAKFDQVTVL
jgi:hypothetical protein